MPTPEFYAIEEIRFKGDEERGIPSLIVPATGRLPDVFQSYPKLRPYPEMWGKVFDAMFPGNNVADPERPIVTKTVADSFAEGDPKGPVGARRKPKAHKGEVPGPSPSPEAKTPSAAPGDESDNSAKESFDGLGLPHQAVTSLVSAGFDLAKCQAAGDDEILALPGVGPGSLIKIREAKK